MLVSSVVLPPQPPVANELVTDLHKSLQKGWTMKTWDKFTLDAYWAYNTIAEAEVSSGVEKRKKQRDAMKKAKRKDKLTAKETKSEEDRFPQLQQCMEEPQTLQYFEQRDKATKDALDRVRGRLDELTSRLKKLTEERAQTKAHKAIKDKRLSL